MPLPPESFVEERSPRWRRLEELTQRPDLASLSPSELDEFARLYRRAAGDLAYAQTHYPYRADLIYHLNHLVGRAHSHLYLPQRRGVHSVIAFVVHGFPRLVRRRWPYVLAALLLFMGSGTVAFLAGWSGSELASILVPEPMREWLDSTGYRPGTHEIPASIRPVISSYILVNNMQVGLMAFGLGVLFGLGTVYVLLQNGLVIGAVVGAMHQGASAHHILTVWALLLPHGVIELTAIFICGGAGLMLGDALVRAGNLPRAHRLVQMGKEAVQLVTGAALLFGLAALIEAFLTPAGLSNQAKLGIAALTAILLGLYLGSAFLRPQPTGEQPSAPHCQPARHRQAES